MKNNFILWQDKYSVNISIIDEQHKILINMINGLYEDVILKKKFKEVNNTVSKMVDYAATHFSTEEKFFIKFQYNDTINHLKEHKYFIEKVNEFMKKSTLENTSFSLEVLYFLQDWLINHILISDKKYTECFKNGGLS